MIFIMRLGVKVSQCMVIFIGLSKLLTTVSDMARVEPDDTSEEKIVMTDDQFSLDDYNRKQV